MSAESKKSAVKRSPAPKAAAQTSKVQEAVKSATATTVNLQPAASAATAVVEKPVSVIAAAKSVAVAAAQPKVDAQTVTTLIADLHRADADVAREAAATLGESASPAAVEPLIEALTNVDGFYHSVVRAAAA